MNKLEKLSQDCKNISDFSRVYFSYVSDLLRTLNHDDISAFMDVLEEARLSNKTIFIAGNGGSASTASHIGVDCGSVVFKTPALSESEFPFRAQPLTDHIAMITAAGNDFGYEHIFTKQLEVHYREGDILVVISASGSSKNVVKAAHWVHARNGKVLGLLGFDGGTLKDVCDVSIVVKTPKGEYGPVEDIHLILNHMFTAWMYLKFTNKQK